MSNLSLPDANQLRLEYAYSSSSAELSQRPSFADCLAFATAIAPCAAAEPGGKHITLTQGSSENGSVLMSTRHVTASEAASLRAANACCSSSLRSAVKARPSLMACAIAHAPTPLCRLCPSAAAAAPSVRCSHRASCPPPPAASAAAAPQAPFLLLDHLHHICVALHHWHLELTLQPQPSERIVQGDHRRMRVVARPCKALQLLQPVVQLIEAEKEVPEVENS